MKALLVGIALSVGSIWLPQQVIEPMARALIPATALLATAIFPCMSLAVSALKGDSRSPGQVDELYQQLHTVLKVLVATFTLAVLAVVLLVAMTALTALTVKPHNHWIDLGITATLCVVSAVLSLLVGRAVAVGRAFFAILEINRRHALLVARAKVQGDREKALGVFRGQKFAEPNPETQPLEKVD
jgi:hypothetical protein